MASAAQVPARDRPEPAGSTANDAPSAIAGRPSRRTRPGPASPVGRAGCGRPSGPSRRRAPVLPRRWRPRRRPTGIVSRRKPGSGSTLRAARGGQSARSPGDERHPDCAAGMAGATPSHFPTNCCRPVMPSASRPSPRLIACRPATPAAPGRRVQSAQGRDRGRDPQCDTADPRCSGRSPGWPPCRRGPSPAARTARRSPRRRLAHVVEARRGRPGRGERLDVGDLVGMGARAKPSGKAIPGNPSRRGPLRDARRQPPRTLIVVRRGLRQVVNSASLPAQSTSRRRRAVARSGAVTDGPGRSSAPPLR